jgi:hypothetical protein
MEMATAVRTAACTEMVPTSGGSEARTSMLYQMYCPSAALKVRDPTYTPLRTGAAVSCKHRMASK